MEIKFIEIKETVRYSYYSRSWDGDKGYSYEGSSGASAFNEGVSIDGMVYAHRVANEVRRLKRYRHLVPTFVKEYPSFAKEEDELEYAAWARERRDADYADWALHVVQRPEAMIPPAFRNEVSGQDMVGAFAAYVAMHEAAEKVRAAAIADGIEEFDFDELLEVYAGKWFTEKYLRLRNALDRAYERYLERVNYIRSIS